MTKTVLKSTESHARYKAVPQEEPTGCAIACAATIAGLTYGQTRQIANDLGIYAEDQKLWSETAYIRRILTELGFAAASEETIFDDWKDLPDLALLSTKWHLAEGRPYWHWVVFVRDGEDAYVLDSKAGIKSHIRRDFGRIKPKWYIAIDAPIKEKV